jgi:hypothetical protein
MIQAYVYAVLFTTLLAHLSLHEYTMMIKMCRCSYYVPGLLRHVLLQGVTGGG